MAAVVADHDGGHDGREARDGGHDGRDGRGGGVEDGDCRKKSGCTYHLLRNGVRDEGKTPAVTYHPVIGQK